MTAIRKILIANRGAIARRVIRACEALGIASVAVYSEADAGAPWLAEASEAWPLPGARATETYLNQPLLLDVLRRSGADAVHPGYGFLAEQAEFAAAVLAAGAVFIGPRPLWLQRLGDKLAAREWAAAAGFPVLPGSGALTDLAHATAAADTLGYPLMLKPAAGGGGIGMSRIADRAALAGAWSRAAQLAGAAFGDARLYLEACVERPRHVEIQLLGDGRGAGRHLYERDCSLQRRHQKVIEETPAPGLDRALLDALADRAAGLVAASGYDGLGTLETLVAAEPGRPLQLDDFRFIEFNPRIQVEHGVTEAVTGVDLVAEQIRLAAGGTLPVRPPLHGHAVEARVYAEDPATGRPSTGTLRHLRMPRMHGVRVETGYAPGLAVTHWYDPLLAKVIGWGTTRAQAIGRTLVGVRALEISGVATNVPLLERILQHPAFLAGEVDTGFLHRKMVDWREE